MNKKSLVLGILIGLSLGFLSKSFFSPLPHSNVRFSMLEKATSQRTEPASKVIRPKEVGLSKLNTLTTGVLQTTTEEPTQKIELSDDFGLEIAEMSRDIPRPGEVLSKSPSPDGGYYTRERLSDGSIAHRSYTPKGILGSESRESGQGEEMVRSFYENGQTKALKRTFLNGSTSVVSYDRSGIYTGRTDQFTSGEHISYEYDDNGAITKRWLIRPNKKPVLLPAL